MFPFFSSVNTTMSLLSHQARMILQPVITLPAQLPSYPEVNVSVSRVLNPWMAKLEFRNSNKA